MTTRSLEIGAPTRRRVLTTRYFYTAAGVLIALFVAIGFGAFYFKGRAYPDRPITPPIRALVIAHGLAMTAWVALMVLQPTLIALRRRKLHMAVGRVGALVAAAVVVLGFPVALRSPAVAPEGAMIWGLGVKPFFAVPFFSIVLFAAFVAIGIAKVKQPAVHRAMMLLATLAALGAAVSRIDALNNLYLGTVWDRLFGPLFGTLVFGALLLLARSLLTRRLDRVFAYGLAALTVASLGIWQLAVTETWNRFTVWLIG